MSTKLQKYSLVAAPSFTHNMSIPFAYTVGKQAISTWNDLLET